MITVNLIAMGYAAFVRYKNIKMYKKRRDNIKRIIAKKLLVTLGYKMMTKEKKMEWINGIINALDNAAMKSEVPLCGDESDEVILKAELRVKMQNNLIEKRRK
jgi:hypothetical protein